MGSLKNGGLHFICASVYIYYFFEVMYPGIIFIKIEFTLKMFKHNKYLNPLRQSGVRGNGPSPVSILWIELFEFQCILKTMKSDELN